MMPTPTTTSGLSEESVEFSHPRSVGRTSSVPTVRATLGEGGRLVIPAEMRRAMGVKPGDALVLKVNDGELTVVSQLVSVRRIQQRLDPYKGSGGNVDEFLADRRKEQRRSDERFDRLHSEGMATKSP